MTDGKKTEVGELAERIKRLYPYIKDGGVTFSGGEPCMQAGFLSLLARELRAMGLHLALDTSGCVSGDEVRELLSLIDLVLLDIKFTTDEAYKRNTGSGIGPIFAFLDELAAMGKPTWIRQVVVPGINDTEADMRALKEIVSRYPNIERVELLPFRKLCLEKYDEMGIEFPLRDTPEMKQSDVDRLYEYLDN